MLQHGIMVTNSNTMSLSLKQFQASNRRTHNIKEEQQVGEMNRHSIIYGTHGACKCPGKFGRDRAV